MSLSSERMEWILEQLAPHAKRKLRPMSTLLAPDDAAHDPFWELVYAGVPEVSYEIAEAVERELIETDKTVDDLVGGWRPATLLAVLASKE